MPRPAFEQMLGPHGSHVAGSAQEVIEKLLALHVATGMDRFVGRVDIGGPPFADVARGIERFAADVAPVVRKATAKQGCVSLHAERRIAPGRSA